MRNLTISSMLLLCSVVLLQAATIDQSNNWERSSSPPIHIEILGTFVFEQYSDHELILTATIEKKLLVKALQKEGNCLPKDMLRVCGDLYLADHFEVQLNKEKVGMIQESLKVGKDYITVSYLLKSCAEKINQVNINSDYLMEYNDHGILRVVFEMGKATKSYTLRPNKKSISASFK